MEHNEQDNMKQDIMNRIKSGELDMRPRIYFMLKLAALIVLMVATLVVSIFILTFILFSIRINSQDVLLGFGSRGLTTFLRFFPWGLLFIDIALIFLSQHLLRQFRFGYRIPALYVLA